VMMLSRKLPTKRNLSRHDDGHRGHHRQRTSAAQHTDDEREREKRHHRRVSFSQTKMIG
jgi:hypothetical protein